MRFILVNGRSPCSRSFCAKCKQPIVENYLREGGTSLIYCEVNCYTDHCKSAAQIVARQARAS
jgi:hypothetical protein